MRMSNRSGAEAPPLALIDPAGEAFALERFRGRPVLLGGEVAGSPRCFRLRRSRSG